MASHRFSDYLRSEADVRRQSGFTTLKPIRVTPGQWTELCAELGREPTHFETCQGSHPIERIPVNIKATGDNVVLCPRDDLFSETDRSTGIELVSLANSVTSVPDNIGCVEIVSVGELVTCVKPGQIAFLDFYSVKQGYIIANEEAFIAAGDAFAALYDPITQQILPLDNFVVTRPVPERFKIALTGTDRIAVPEDILAEGFVSGRNSDGSIGSQTVYHEVVRMGTLTTRSRPGVMTPAERALLDTLNSSGIRLNLIHAVLEERAQGRTPDFEAGDLVGFCKAIGLRIRVRGEYQWIVPYENVLGVIDDAGILKRAIANDRAGKILRRAS